jgi:mono/diheme cytochrome c family protein
MRTSTSLCFVITSLAAACGSSDNATVTGYQIVAKKGSSLTAVAGDAVQLQVVETLSDGNTRDVADGTKVTWTAPQTITTLAPDDTADSPVPDPGADPLGFFIANPTRTDDTAPLEGVLFVRDAGSGGPGTIAVSATISAQTASVTANVTVGPTPDGDAVRGKAKYSVNCAICHGQTADGSPPQNKDGTYTVYGQDYDFPAPGLNNTQENVGADPDWTAAILAVAARSDADDAGVALRLPMPPWMTYPDPDTNAPLTTQDFADIYAYLVSETN